MSMYVGKKEDPHYVTPLGGREEGVWNFEWDWQEILTIWCV